MFPRNSAESFEKENMKLESKNRTVGRGKEEGEKKREKWRWFGREFLIYFVVGQRDIATAGAFQPRGRRLSLEESKTGF